jgi:DNA-binding CsgD family transcriptional regulator
VNSHLRNLRRKFGVDTDIALVAEALRLGFR